MESDKKDPDFSQIAYTNVTKKNDKPALKDMSLSNKDFVLYAAKSTAIIDVKNIVVNPKQSGQSTMKAFSKLSNDYNNSN